MTVNRIRQAVGRRRAAVSGDAGLTLIELMVTVVLLGILVAAAAKIETWTSHDTPTFAESVHEQDAISQASQILTANVHDAWVIRRATSSELVMLVRVTDPAHPTDSGSTTCAIRDWKIDPASRTLTLTSTPYDTPDCTGPSGRPAVLISVPRIRVPQTQFSFKMKDSLLPIDLTSLDGGQVQDGRHIGLVEWTLQADPYSSTTDAAPLEIVSAAHADAKAADPANRSTVVQGTAPMLTVTTTPEGRAQPQLTWVDTSPAVTASWTIMRDAYPENDPSQTSGWMPVAFVMDPTILTWTDADLPAGYTASYTVHAVIKDPLHDGPASNVVVTGLRPATVTNVIATGKPTSVDLTWDTAVGATGYDLYRDGTLFAWTTGHDATSFTDGPGVYGWAGDGYGHSHTYSVSAENRWDDLLVTGHQGQRLTPTSTPTPTVTTLYTGAVRNVSGVTAASGAFTAPDPPTITVTPNTSWGMTVAWTPAPWTGSGPTTKGGVSRDRGWLVSTNGSNSATPNGAWSAEWAGAENAAGTTSRLVSYTQAQIGGQYRTYRATTANAVGASNPSTTVTGLQRPPTPTCTASSSSTRSASVTVDRPSIPSTYTASEVTGGVKADGAGSITGTGQGAGATFNIDGLKHATSHTFTARNANASPANGGWSDTTACAVTTRTLGVSITGTSSSTRTITATASAQEGSSQNITLEGVATIGGLSGSWDPLPDGTGYTLTARNSDGVNDVAAQASVSTKVLTAPGAPSCSVSVTDSLDPGAITVSGGSQVKLGSTGTAYTSPRSFTALSSGTYTGYARNVASDGYNTSYSGWVGCGTGTVAPSTLGFGYSGWDSICAAHADDGAVVDAMYNDAANILGAAWGDLQYIPLPRAVATAAVLISDNGATFSCAFSVVYVPQWSSTSGQSGPALGEHVYGTAVKLFNLGGGGPIGN